MQLATVASSEGGINQSVSLAGDQINYISQLLRGSRKGDKGHKPLSSQSHSNCHERADFPDHLLAVRQWRMANLICKICKT